MKLYHISRSTEITEMFIPRLPELSISNEEIQTINRVSVSKTIKGCFSAVYFGCRELKYSRWVNNLYDDTPKGQDNKYLYPFKLYVFDTDYINLKDIVSSKEIVRYGVMDALLTDEYWILNNIVPKEVYNYYVTSFKGELKEMVNGKKVYVITEIKGRKERLL